MSSITKKQPYEEFPRYVDFSLNMLSTETIIDKSVTAVNASGEDATDVVTNQATLSVVGQRVYIVVKGGVEADSPYILTYRCETSTNSKWEEEVKLVIKDTI